MVEDIETKRKEDELVLKQVRDNLLRKKHYGQFIKMAYQPLVDTKKKTEREEKIASLK